MCLQTMRIVLLLVFGSLYHCVQATEESGYDFVCWQSEVSCGCGRQNVHLSESRMINGEDAVPYSWSMLVSIRLKGSDKHACGGTVLNESYVLTSATCVAETSIIGMTVTAGHHYFTDSNTVVRRVDGVFVHPNYTGNTRVWVWVDVIIFSSIAGKLRAAFIRAAGR